MAEIYDGDEIEQLLIPIALNPRKRIENGHLDFDGEPIKVGPSRYANNILQLLNLLRAGFVVLTAFDVTIGRELYLFMILYRPR